MSLKSPVEPEKSRQILGEKENVCTALLKRVKADTQENAGMSKE
jgi:hypothetical protein